MRLLMILPAVLALTACSTAPIPPPAIVVRTVEVDRPVPVPCVAAADIPTEPAKVGGDLTGDAINDADLLASSALHLRVALSKALALLGACKTVDP